MVVHKVTEKEWRSMSEVKKIEILRDQALSYKEACELSESKKLSDLPNELRDLRYINVKMNQKDWLNKKVFNFINTSTRPTHTAEVARQFSKFSHHQILMALIYLLENDRIEGRILHVARGIWIWWPKNVFNKKVKGRNT